MYSDSVDGCRHVVVLVVGTRYIFPDIKALYPQSISMSERPARSVFFTPFSYFFTSFFCCTFLFNLSW